MVTKYSFILPIIKRWKKSGKDLLDSSTIYAYSNARSGDKFKPPQLRTTEKGKT